MAVYCITYDLKRPGQNYDPLWEALAKMGARRVLLSVWVVATTSTAVQVRDHLQSFLDRNDAILVARLRVEAAWSGVDHSDWLKQILESQAT
jgi:hypothetical protein